MEFEEWWRNTIWTGKGLVYETTYLTSKAAWTEAKKNMVPIGELEEMLKDWEELGAWEPMHDLRKLIQEYKS